jgi:hypothetical protein
MTHAYFLVGLSALKSACKLVKIIIIIIIIIIIGLICLQWYCTILGIFT